MIGSLPCEILLLSAQLAASPRMPENLYKGELVHYPGPWSFRLGRQSVILVSDEELVALTDPDKVLNLQLTFQPREESLRQICERAKNAGQRTLILSFDHFFAQYRPGQRGKPRELTPDREETIRHIAKISQFAQKYGLGLELSLLTPLEIGPGYAKETGEQGRWMHFRKGLRDPGTGSYSVQLWRHRKWANNKGPLEVKDAGVRVFAFEERRIRGTPYLAVDPKQIVDISETAQVEIWPDAIRTAGEFEAVRIRIHGKGGKADKKDRVLVVQQYETPEMDYFSAQALPYLTSLVDRYVEAGVRFNALYSDEMHIQQDWAYFSHHDHGEFPLRYVSEGLAHQYAQQFGEPYEDMSKYMLYFVHGQEDFAGDLTAKQDLMHVFGGTPEQIQETALFRSRYYRLLQDGVVNLFVAAKRHLEKKMGYRLDARAHATWAESPTIDKWEVGEEHLPPHQYEYTPNFIWSDTVHQAAAACHDYFKWGDFLTGNGNDHAEGGWLDRNYYGLALGCSTGILNEVPYSYAAHWGMPAEVSRRRQALVNAYGASAWPPYGMVQGMEHRHVGVLMLYPLDLVAVDERFGSWMTQYGYANYITQDKLIENGAVKDGALVVADRPFQTLVTLFEPFPRKELLEMMEKLVSSGGRVVWSGPPPILYRNGSNALERWSALMGAVTGPTAHLGKIAPGREVVFEGLLEGVRPMPILTDFVVDRAYPVTPLGEALSCAKIRNDVVGTHRFHPSGGSVTFLGFRPRDDQSSSLGYETRTWFDVLNHLNAYPSSGAFPDADVNDSPEFLSRNTKYLVCQFPNGAVSLAPHLKDLVECWNGGFARKKEEDDKIVAGLDLPEETISLKDFHVAGHQVSFEGQHALAFRSDEENRLIAFCSHQCQEIEVNGQITRFSDGLLPVAAWAPVQEHRRTQGGAIVEMFFGGAGTVHIPLPWFEGEGDVFAEGPTPGSRGQVIECSLDQGVLHMDVPQSCVHRWLFFVPKTETKQ